MSRHFKTLHYIKFPEQIRFSFCECYLWKPLFFIFFHDCRCGFKIEEPSGGNVSVLLQSQFPRGQSPWHLSTKDILRPLGLVRPTAVWTRQVLGRDHYHITCQSRAMHLSCTCTIHYHRTDIRQEPLLQNPLHTAPKSVSWQRRLTAWEDPRSRIPMSPFRSMVPGSNFHLVRMLLRSANLPVMVAADHLGPWRHTISAKNTSSVLSGITPALQCWGWKLKSIQW